MKRIGQSYSRSRDNAAVWFGMVLLLLEDLFDLPDARRLWERTAIRGRTSRWAWWAWWARLVAGRVVIVAGLAGLWAFVFEVTFLEAAIPGVLLWWLVSAMLSEQRRRRPSAPPRSGGSPRRRRPRGGDDGSGSAPVFAKLPPGPHGPLVGAAAKSLPKDE